MTVKEKLYQLCVEALEMRLKTIKSKVEDIQQSLTSETKSTAGDKHETGRAMLQLEREKAGQQLSELQKLQNTLSRINPKSTHEIVALGTIVQTTNAYYFISISVGELSCDGQLVYAISANTPMAKVLFGKCVGDTVTFRNDTFEIISLH
ncbi:3-oxoacyl-ACP synthase [Winogradskyella maritima]|uniref:3-oxoacyl-ACP synthase n=1 Tax=Winogradskyella maritima TaxID=1517766 RepID=A0ABV8AGX1_9FLAO|nr:3-oxoacyl-ACP synthase [Winogradskyella maritima]